MVHNPGGDWNPGWGVVPRYTAVHRSYEFSKAEKCQGFAVQNYF